MESKFGSGAAILLGLLLMLLSFLATWQGWSLGLMEINPAIFIGGSVLVGSGVLAAAVGLKRP